jgi:hypothetical protein
MARAIKTGLDYFPHDCANDTKIEYLEAEHGIAGYAIFFKLLERVYLENGYYMSATDKSIKLFAKRNNVEFEIVENIITTCIGEDLFDKDIFKKYGILTSNGIQKRYKEATGKRKQNDIKKEYKIINSELTAINSELMDEIVVLGTQSKVKESKVNKSKGKEIEITPSKKLIFINDFKNLWTKYFPIQILSPGDNETIRQIKYRISDHLQAAKKKEGAAYFSVSDPEIIEALTVILEKLPDFWKDKIDLKMFFNKFNSIIQQISSKNGKASNTKHIVDADKIREAREQLIREGL